MSIGEIFLKKIEVNSGKVTKEQSWKKKNNVGRR